MNCLKEIVENTQKFPRSFPSLPVVFLMKISGRIEKEIFPEYKDDDLNLLEVTWNEDYVQQLGNHLPSIIYDLMSSVPRQSL